MHTSCLHKSKVKVNLLQSQEHARLKVGKSPKGSLLWGFASHFCCYHEVVPRCVARRIFELGHFQDIEINHNLATIIIVTNAYQCHRCEAGNKLSTIYVTAVAQTQRRIAPAVGAVGIATGLKPNLTAFRFGRVTLMPIWKTSIKCNSSRGA